MLVHGQQTKEEANFKRNRSNYRSIVGLGFYQKFFTALHQKHLGSSKIGIKDIINKSFKKYSCESYYYSIKLQKITKNYKKKAKYSLNKYYLQYNHLKKDINVEY